MNESTLPGYDWRQSYDWNYEHVPPLPSSLRVPELPARWRFCGRAVPSPLGLAAGPLLNGRWILYYAALGFDVLTYKTVRSRARACYPLPNLQPVQFRSLPSEPEALPASREMNGSWAVSFGMPSRAPEVWRADVEKTRRALSPEKLLSVSVVATPEPDWTVDDLAEDFVRCARWAVESGADTVEANFSCPNVSSADAQLYQQPEVASLVAGRLRKAVGATPLLIKIGHVTQVESVSLLAAALAPHIDALVMVNCISALVADDANQLLFEGQKRGIAGDAIREAALAQVKLFNRAIREQRLKLELVGVGGITNAGHVLSHLQAGSQMVQLATAAMLDPLVGVRIRKALAEETAHLFNHE